MSASFGCLACASAEGEAVFLGCRDYYLGKPYVVDYHRCRACGLLQQSPLPTDVSAFYEAYPIHARKSLPYRLLRRLVMGPVYYPARRRHPAGTLLLDYGCGDGGYLESQKGTGLDLVGYETDPAQAERLARELAVPVLASREGLRQRYAGRVGVLTLHFVLEHVMDLDAACGDAATLLAPGGILYCVVPNPASLEARLFGRRWHNLDPPRHISFPDHNTMCRLADRHGFRLEDEWPVAFPNSFAASLAVVLGGRFRFPIFALCLPLGIVFSRLLPTGSRAFLLRRL